MKRETHSFDLMPERINEIEKKIDQLLEQKNPPASLEYLTRKEVMEILKIGSFSTIMELERNNVLKPISIGRKYLYRKDDIANIGRTC